MPERYEPDEHAEGGPCMVASEYGQWVALCDYSTLESRLLAAEARVREVEAAFKKYGDHWGQCPAMTPRRKCNCGYDQARAILAREGA